MTTEVLNPAPLTARQMPAATLPAWRVREQQVAEEHEACFMTEQRYTCHDRPHCRWRKECQRLCAEWLR